MVPVSDVTVQSTLYARHRRTRTFYGSGRCTSGSNADVSHLRLTFSYTMSSLKFDFIKGPDPDEVSE